MFKREKRSLLLLVITCVFSVAQFSYFFSIYATNNPYLDDFWAVYNNIFLLENSFTDPNGIPYILHPNLEHIISYTIILSWTLYKTLGDNFSLSYLMLIGDLAWFATIGFIMYRFYKIHKPNLFWLAIIILIGVSMQLHENLFWGMAATQNLTIVLFSFLSFYFLIENTKNSYRIGVFFGILSFLTSSPGLLVLGIGFLILLIKKQFKRAAFWFLMAGILVFIYIRLLTYSTPMQLQNFKNIFYLAGGMLHFEGQQWPAFIFGLSIVAFILFYCFKYVIRNLTLVDNFELFILSNIIFIGLVIILGSLKREYILISRYKIYSVLLVINCIILIYHRWASFFKENKPVWLGLFICALSYNFYCAYVYSYDMKKLAQYKWADAHNYYVNKRFDNHFFSLCDNAFFTHKVQITNTNIYKNPSITYLIENFNNIPIKESRFKVTEKYHQEGTSGNCTRKLLSISIRADSTYEYYYLMIESDQNHLFSFFPDRYLNKQIYTQVDLQYLGIKKYDLYLITEKNGVFSKQRLHPKHDPLDTKTIAYKESLATP